MPAIPLIVALGYAARIPRVGVLPQFSPRQHRPCFPSRYDRGRLQFRELLSVKEDQATQDTFKCKTFRDIWVWGVAKLVDAREVDERSSR